MRRRVALCAIEARSINRVQLDKGNFYSLKYSACVISSNILSTVSSSFTVNSSDGFFNGAQISFFVATNTPCLLKVASINLNDASGQAMIVAISSARRKVKGRLFSSFSIHVLKFSPLLPLLFVLILLILL
jgi:hypothetical protein